MIRAALITLIALASIGQTAFSNTLLTPTQMGEVQGIVTNAKNEALEFVDVVAVKNGRQVESIQTDMDGAYSLLLPPGTYTIYFSKVTFKTDTIKDFTVSAGQLRFLNVTMSPPGYKLPPLVVRRKDKEPVLDIGGKNPSFKAQGPMLDNTPAPSKLHVLNNAPTVYTRDDGEALTVGGQSRTNTTAIYINGYRYYGNLEDLPDHVIEEISVSFTGVSAKYGDFTGGVIEVTTRSF